MSNDSINKKNETKPPESYLHKEALSINNHPPTNSGNHHHHHPINNNKAKSSIVRSKSTPYKTICGVKRRKSVTFADEVGQDLIESIYYTPEVAYLDDMQINYNTKSDILNEPQSTLILSQSSTIKKSSKYNFDNFRNVDTLTKTNYYGIHSNNVALKSLIDSNFCINIAVIVKNISFEKVVNIHYTYDGWKTKYYHICQFLCQSNDIFDIFSCKINYDQFKNQKTLLFKKKLSFEFAIEYIVNDHHYWDNNNGQNYTIKV